MTETVWLADGRQISVEVSGNPSGRSVFLLHGTPGSRLGPRPRGMVLYRLGVLRHHLPWCELDALRAHAALDRAEPTDLGWAARADTLNASLVPSGLDPDPLAIVEQ